MGKSVAIIGDGEFPRGEYPLYLIASADIVICCDGAFETFLQKKDDLFGGRMPDAVVGDMDSLSEELQEKYSGIVKRISEQDDNDQTKAVLYVAETYPEVQEIHILGAGGKREDHTIGNLSLLMEYARDARLSSLQIDMVSDYTTSFAVTDTCSLAVGEGREVSLFSPDNSLVLRSHGLEYPTDDVVWDNWWKATLNRAQTDVIGLEFSHPSLLLVVLS